MIASSVVSRIAKTARLLAAFVAVTSCVPKEAPDGSTVESDAFLDQPPKPSKWRPRPNVRPAFQLDTRVTQEGGTEVSSDNPALATIFTDSFNRDELGPEYAKTSDRWMLKAGRLCAQGARNHPVWLKRRLPLNARIAFTARSHGADGDLKVEAWGSGRSHAKGLSYVDATSYLFVFGGWKNRLHVLARLNEHGTDRREVALEPDSQEPRRAPVEPNRDYRFVIERNNGRTVTWTVDDEPILSFEDGVPLAGPTHDHFGFNDWNVEVCFDDLVVTPLPE
ncbi:MAG: hypothetical protein QM784_28425 [Polyangiaceae bacterium]